MAAAARGRHAVRLRIAETAKADIEDLLAWSEQRFGLAARQRYEVLLACAVFDVAEDLSRPGVQARPELGAGLFSYHLFHSRERAAGCAGSTSSRVQRPRHLLVGRIAGAGLVDIVRVLHDAMEVSHHLPRRADAEGEPT